jgi:hypothetical protein
LWTLICMYIPVSHLCVCQEAMCRSPNYLPRTGLWSASICSIQVWLDRLTAFTSAGAAIAHWPRVFWVNLSVSVTRLRNTYIPHTSHSKHALVAIAHLHTLMTRYSIHYTSYTLTWGRFAWLVGCLHNILMQYWAYKHTSNSWNNWCKIQILLSDRSLVIFCSF